MCGLGGAATANLSVMGYRVRSGLVCPLPGPILCERCPPRRPARTDSETHDAGGSCVIPQVKRQVMLGRRILMMAGCRAPPPRRRFHLLVGRGHGKSDSPLGDVSLPAPAHCRIVGVLRLELLCCEGMAPALVIE